MKIWSKPLVVQQIKSRHQAGLPVNSGYVQIHENKLYLAACKYCGSWRKAIRASGLRWSDIKVKKRICPRWSKDIVTQEIQSLYTSNKPLNSNWMQLHRHDLYGAAVNYWGGWRQAIEAAGFSYEEVRVRELRSWTKARILKAIKSRRDQGLPLGGSSVSAQDQGLYGAARRHFGRGGWSKALRKAGIDPRSVNPGILWTRERVTQEIHDLHRDKIPLYGHYLTKHGKSSLHGSGIKLFGSWKRAIQRAGLNYDDIRATRHNWWNERRILAAIRRLDRLGERLSSKRIHGLHGDLLSAAILWFGTWGAAVETAGIDYQSHLLHWSAKTWLRNISTAQSRSIKRRARTLAIERRKHNERSNEHRHH